MLKFLFLFLFSLGIYGQTTGYDMGYYWVAADGQTTTKATGSNIAGYYDSTKPTVIYYHGWQNGTCANGTCRRENFIFLDPTQSNASVNTIANWKSQGWNVGIFYWNQFADESEVKDAEGKIWSISSTQGMRYKLPNGTYSSTGSPTSAISDIAYTDFLRIMGSYTGTEIRLAGHSLGSQLATIVTYKLFTTKSSLMPKKLELLDPFWSKDAKTYLGDQVNGTTTSTCLTKNNSNDWVGERIRCYIGIMTANRTTQTYLPVTWLKTSAVGTTGVGDANDGLKSIVALVNCNSAWWSLTQQTEKHVWAKNVYFWSKGNKGTTAGFPYADASLTDIRTAMNRGGTSGYSQTAGTTTATPSDDTFK